MFSSVRTLFLRFIIRVRLMSASSPPSYYLGTWPSYIFLSQSASDYVGRRFAALTGAFVACIGSAIETSANGSAAYTMMIVGRIISGLGLAVISTSVPLYQSEIALASRAACTWS
jgi:MFS family permease